MWLRPELLRDAQRKLLIVLIPPEWNPGGIFYAENLVLRADGLREYTKNRFGLDFSRYI